MRPWFCHPFAEILFQGIKSIVFPVPVEHHPWHKIEFLPKFGCLIPGYGMQFSALFADGAFPQPIT
jgi:hypothetical protein